MTLNKPLLILSIVFVIILLLPDILVYILKKKEHSYENFSYAKKKEIAIKDMKLLSKQDGKLKLGKLDDHVYRTRDDDVKKLDLNYFNKIIDIDLDKKIINVEGLVRFDDLLDYTLKYGYMPLVIPELRSITVGGVISGVGIESSSFKHGLFHDSVIEYEVLTSEGKVVTANKKTNKDLFKNIPNSYGSLGYILSAKLKIQKSKPYVRVVNRKYNDIDTYLKDLECFKNDKKVDFIDGLLFNPNELYLMTGYLSDNAEYTNSYRIDIYYKSIKNRKEDYMTLKDYIWRFDSNYFFIGFNDDSILNNKLFRLYFNKMLRSDLLRLLEKNNIFGRFVKSSKPKNETIVNDISLDPENFKKFFLWYNEEVNVYPVWVCPYVTKRNTFFQKKGIFEIDFGIGFGVNKYNDTGDKDYYKKLIDEKIASLGKKKGLYSQTFLSKDKFWEIYGPEDKYFKIKNKYDPNDKLIDFYSKIVRNK